ncbi:MAG: hypothetical protein RLY43_796 [Bacteroidota bacterium]|jgi:hypothetical protein
MSLLEFLIATFFIVFIKLIKFTTALFTKIKLNIVKYLQNKQLIIYKIYLI